MMNEEVINENVNENLHNSDQNRDTEPIFDQNESTDAPENSEGESDVNYAELIVSDAMELAKQFPELEGIKDITELENPLRYAALRDLGLSPAEAYLATTRVRKRDNRAHLYATRAISSSTSTVMSEGELAAAREIFSGVSDSEIRSLYKRVAGR